MCKLRLALIGSAFLATGCAPALSAEQAPTSTLPLPSPTSLQTSIDATSSASTAVALGGSGWGDALLAFPTRPADDLDNMTADLPATLVVEDGCLRARTDTNENYMLIWPSGFNARLMGGVIQVLDSRGEIVGEVGDVLGFGGGETTSFRTVEPVPDACPGPYWVIAEIMDRRTP